MSATDLREATHLSPNAVGMLGVVTAVAIANGYYVQPLLPLMVASVSLPHALTGILPALSQFGFVIGIITVLPLADSLSARHVLFAAVPMQMAALLIIALSWTPPMLMVGCLLVGVAGITPYVLPPYASLRISSERLGTVNGVLIRGVNCGILLARAAAGIIAVHLGWRSVYLLAATAMAGVLLAVSRIVKPQRPAAPVGYSELIRSLWTLPRAEPKLRTAALCQACNFGTFNTFWLGSTFYLHEHWGWRPDAIGYVSLLGAGAAFCAPHFGGLASRVGPARTRLFAFIVILAAWALFAVFRNSLVGMAVALVLIDLAATTQDVSSRTIIYTLAPEYRTRVNAVYTIAMFLGGCLTSFLVGFAWTAGGWLAICALGAVTAGMGLGLLARQNSLHAVQSTVGCHAEERCRPPRSCA